MYIGGLNMKLFLVGLKKYFGYQIELEEMERNRTKLIIPNLVENDSEYEKIEFILPMAKEKVYRTDNSVDFLKLRPSKNQYKFEGEMIGDSKIIYALLHNSNYVPSDIYIPADMKNKVEVLKHFRFYDCEPDYGQYIAQIYFVKIKLSQLDTIPFYFTFSNPSVLDRHIVFEREEQDINMLKCNTCIRMNLGARDTYMPLSKV